MPTTRPDPVPLFFQEYGAGPPLVILHGLFGSLDNWHTLARKLGETFRVFAVDQRNHGRSPHSPEFSYTAMAEDLRAFLDERGVKKSALIGHSMGGKTAMQFAVTYPRRVTHLIVVDIGPQAYERQHNLVLEALCGLDLKDFSTRGEVDAALAKQLDDPSVRQFLLKNLKREEDGTFGWKMNLPVIRDRYDEVNAALQGDEIFEGPVLFVRGTKSPSLTRAAVDAARSRFPDAQLVEVDSGHWVHAEKPDAFLGLVLDFLSI